MRNEILNENDALQIIDNSIDESNGWDSPEMQRLVEWIKADPEHADVVFHRFLMHILMKDHFKKKSYGALIQSSDVFDDKQKKLLLAQSGFDALPAKQSIWMWSVMAVTILAVVVISFGLYYKINKQISLQESPAIWTGKGDGSVWTDKNNWEPAIFPDNKIDVSIGGDAYVNFMYSHFERSADTELTGNTKLEMVNKRFLNANSAPAVLTVADNAQIKHTGPYFIVGKNATGTINQTGGSITTKTDNGFFLTDWPDASGSAYYLKGGTLNVEFADSDIVFHFEFLGRHGANSLFLVDGGEAHFKVSSPKNREIYILNGGSSTFQVDSGLAEFTGFKNFVVGHEGEHHIADGVANVIVNGGEMIVDLLDTGAMIVGGQNGQGYIEVNGGRLTINGNNDLFIGDNQKGTVTQNGGDVVIEGRIALGMQATAIDSSYNMTGGTLKVRDIVLHEGAHAGTKFVFDGGLITLDGDRREIVDELWFKVSPDTKINYDNINNITTLSR